MNRAVLLAAAFGIGVATASNAPAQTVSAISADAAATNDRAVRAARPLSREEARGLRPFDQFRECDRCPEMIVAPAGWFVMGAGEEEAGSTSDERPQHPVSFTRPFAIGRFAVKMNEWDACVMAKACQYRPDDLGWGRGTQPVLNLLWDDAKEYVAWLSRITGRPYRLPSEAEREYIARAATTTAYWWGNSFEPGMANTADREFHSASAGEMESRLVERPVPVRSFAPNAWGFYQVHGNVYDWVEDCWHEDYVGAPSDGSAWISEVCGGHVLRGGAFSRTGQVARSAARMWSGAYNRMMYMSVRVARTIDR